MTRHQSSDNMRAQIAVPQRPYDPHTFIPESPITLHHHLGGEEIALSRSEAPTRRASIDDGSTYHPPRVDSDPTFFPDTPQLMPIYPRRQSKLPEAPRPDAFSPFSPQPTPSSLLRPPSANQVPTLQTLQQLQPPVVHPSPPFVDKPHASPTPSILSVTEDLFTPPNHATGSSSSLRDDLDYSRKLGVSISRTFHWGPV